MIRLILFTITLITLTNVSYASFPVHEEILISIDTLKPNTNKIIKKETTEEYHLRMEKQGFYINNCMCIDCRNNPSKSSKEVKVNPKPLLGTLLVWISVLGIILGIMLIQWVIRGFITFNSGPVIG